MTDLDILPADTRQTPWARLGKPLSNTMSAEEAIRQGDLDWDVSLRSLFVSLPGDRKVRIADRKAVVRSTDDAIMGFVGQKYVPFANREAFSFMDTLVDSGEVKYTNVGQSRGGKVIFLSALLPADIKVGGEDPIDLYLLLRTSHDGSKAISVAVTPIRTFCTNQVTYATRKAKSRWSIRHTESAKEKILEARETLTLSFAYAEAWQELGDELLMKTITDRQFEDIVSDLLPDRPRTEQVAEQIMDLYKNSPTNGYHGTAWGGFNAITEYFDHGRQVRSAEAIFTNTVDGHIAKLRDRAAQMLLTR